MSDLTFLTRPSLGRRFTLELRPTHPLTWIGPLTACAMGLLGSGALDLSANTFLRVALALLLVDPILSAWRGLWVQTDWRAPLRVPDVQTQARGNLLPYAQSNSPVARFTTWWNERVAFFSQAVWQTLGATLASLIVLGLIAIAIALVLGSVAVALTLMALALAPIETELGPRHGAWSRAFAELGIAWLIGFAALALPNEQSIRFALFNAFAATAVIIGSPFILTVIGIPTLRVLLSAFLFSLAYRGLLAIHTQAHRRFIWSNLAQIGAAGVMVAIQRPLAAGVIALVVIAQVLWQAFARTGTQALNDYLPRVQWFFLLSMLAAATFPF